MSTPFNTYTIAKIPPNKVNHVEYVKLAKVQDFKNTRIKSYRLLARPVGIIKQKDGTFFATEIGCKHELADLSQGRMDGDVVTCPWHGWKYNLVTGECLWGSKVCLRRHAIRIEGDDIYVSLRPIEDAPPEDDWGPPLR